MMKVAVLSGKGGTGKTLVAASLAKTIRSQYADCDVEEPNGYVFLKPAFTRSVPVMVEVPSADDPLCTGCGRCSEACQFNALATVGGKVIVFSELCHHCGACFLVCGPKALKAVKKRVGVIEIDREGTMLQGKLDIGEPVTIPVITELRKYMREDIPVILDCAPGASCTVVQTVDGCDYCLLVSEPTPFGIYDLKIAVSLVKKMDLPFGILINKVMDKENVITEYCRANDIEILLEIPYSKDIARSYSEGILPVDIDDIWKNKFLSLFLKIKERAGR